MNSISNEYVVSIMSRDRIGILYEISSAIADLRGNIADIRQSVQCGYFTMILLAAFPAGVSQRDIERKLAEVDARSETPIDAVVQRAGEFVSFGGLFGESAIAPLRSVEKSARFVGFGGKIPASIHSLRN
jgi:predicted amino acid-binding ACT domain protein